MNRPKLLPLLWSLAGTTFLLGLLASCHRSSHHAVILKPLDAPEIQSADVNDGVVTLTWSEVDKAETYRVYADGVPGVTPETATLLAELTDTTWAHAGLAPASAWYYAVAAVRKDKVGYLSAEVLVTLPPGMVDVVSITAGDAEVTVSWEDVSGATSYHLYRGTDPGVTPLEGTLLPDVTSPYRDLDVVNDTTYYYVVTAVGDGGEGPWSAEVSACPRWAVGAPTQLTVTVAEEMPNTLVVSWDPPVEVVPDSYNIYWDTAPGVTVGTNPILDVVSPYTHTGLPGRVTYYYIVTAVKGMTESVPSVEVSGMPRGGPGGGEDVGGNNLALPMVFADGYGLTGGKVDVTNPDLDLGTGLRPTADDVTDPFPYFDPVDVFLLNDVEYYKQKGNSTWRPAWTDGSAQPQEVVVDWGDNLASQTFKVGSVIRVETTLYQDTAATDPTDTLTAYQMTHLYGSGVNEMWGTDTTTYESTRRHVFAVHARLTIAKLDGPGGAVDPAIPGFDSAVYEGFGGDGPGVYAAEVNVSGKLVFGYVWMLKQWPIAEEDKRGWWRITFSLDPTAAFGDVTVDNNTFLQELDPSDATAGLDRAENRTWMEILVK